MSFLGKGRKVMDRPHEWYNRKKVVWLEKNGRFSEQAGLYFDRRAT